MLVITTPTGDIGGQVLDLVLNSGEAVRVIARDPSRLSEHVRARAETVEGSHADPSVTAKALEGADGLFWLVPPPPRFQYGGSSERYYLDFTRPMAEAVTGRDIRVVGVSTLGHGYPGKAGLLSAALAMDELIGGTGAGYRALALPFFMENLLRQTRAIAEQGTFSLPSAADRPLPTVATRDAAAVAATLLLDRSWSGRASTPVVGPDTLTPSEMARTIAETLRREVRYHQVPVADFEAMMLTGGLSEAMARDMALMAEAQNAGIYDAEPHEPGSLAATTFRDWCRDILKPAVQA